MFEFLSLSPSVHGTKSEMLTFAVTLCQVLLPLLKSDLYEVILNTMRGKLTTNTPVWHQDSSAVTVVMASAGYPGSYKKGVEITGLKRQFEGLFVKSKKKE